MAVKAKSGKARAKSGKARAKSLFRLHSDRNRVTMTSSSMSLKVIEAMAAFNQLAS